LRFLYVCTIALLAAVTTLPAASQPAAQSPSASAEVSSGYLIVLGRSTDRAKLIAYSSTLPPIYAETGGRYIGLGRPGAGVICVYGLCEGRSAVIATWADQRGIESFWWGERYRKAVPLRDKAGVFTVVGLKGNAGVTAFDGGALLIATAGGNAEVAGAQAWLEEAAKAGARLLNPFNPAALILLEGDALYNRVALLSFASKDKRDAFASSSQTQTFIKGAPTLSLISMIAIDAPQPPPPSAPAIPASSPAVK